MQSLKHWTAKKDPIFQYIHVHMYISCLVTSDCLQPYVLEPTQILCPRGLQLHLPLYFVRYHHQLQKSWQRKKRQFSFCIFTFRLVTVLLGELRAVSATQRLTLHSTLTVCSSCVLRISFHPSFSLHCELTQVFIQKGRE